MSASQRSAGRVAACRPATTGATSLSIWFHGSQCPPGNHGIIPVGSCSEAIHSAVARTSAALRTRGRSGSIGGLAGVHHITLAEDGGQGSLENTHRARLLDDLPLQQALVAVDHF